MVNKPEGVGLRMRVRNLYTKPEVMHRGLFAKPEESKPRGIPFEHPNFE